MFSIWDYHPPRNIFAEICQYRSNVIPECLQHTCLMSVQSLCLLLVQPHYLLLVQPLYLLAGRPAQRPVVHNAHAPRAHFSCSIDSCLLLIKNINVNLSNTTYPRLHLVQHISYWCSKSVFALTARTAYPRTRIATTF